VVPATKAKSPSTTARLYPAAFSNGEPVEIRRRDIGTSIVWAEAEKIMLKR
jgi:hypothetical protein